jgi:hypothetical protein
VFIYLLKKEDGKNFTLGDVLSMKLLLGLKLDPRAPFYTLTPEIFSQP